MNQITPEWRKDSEKWNQLLFENANKFHLHQDNLRWSVTAGFGAFFAAGIGLLHHPSIPEDLAHVLQLLMAIVGTLWFFVVQIEGWYYNLAIAYVVCCERAVATGENLAPLALFDRSKVRSLHPSFFFVLLFIACANAYHVFQYVFSEFEVESSAWLSAALYFIVMLYFIFLGRVPQKLDVTV